MSGISDESIQDASALISRFGATGEELKRLTKAAVDAAAVNGDLSGSAQALGKAFIGETGRLKQYGINIDETTPKALRYSEALRQWNKIYEGAAAAKGKTFFGQIEIAKGSIGDLAKALGAELVPTVQRFVKFLIDNRDVLIKAAQSVGAAIRKWIDDLASVANWVSANKGFFKNLANTIGESIKAGLLGPLNLLPPRVRAFLGLPSANMGGAVAGLAGTKFETPTTVDSAGPAPLLPAGMDAPDKKKPSGDPKEFLRLWKEAFDKTIESSRFVADAIGGIMGGITSALSGSFETLFQKVSDGTATLRGFVNSLALSIRNTMFKVIAELLAKELMVMAVLRANKISEYLFNISLITAEAKMKAMASQAAFGWKGLLLGAALAAAFAALIGSVSAFAEGGIVNRPTLALIGEAGPEAVVPLGSSQGQAMTGGGGGGDVHIHINGEFLEGDVAKWENMVRKNIIPLLAAYQDKTRNSDFRKWPTRS